jgi:hypothetical protein
MMMICCIPMLVIAVALVATGTVGAGFLLTAFLCTAVMALMMGRMNHGGSGEARQDRFSKGQHRGDHH